MRGRIQTANQEMDMQGHKQAQAGDDNVIPCVTWALDLDPVYLPSIPPLPALDNGCPEEDNPTQLIKIAGLDNCLIGLTNKGHVLKISNLENEHIASRQNWEYVRFICLIIF